MLLHHLRLTSRSKPGTWRRSRLHCRAPPPAPRRSGSTSDWYLDSGAAAHMASNPGTLSSLRPSSTHTSVIVGNGAHLPITHVGTGSIATSANPLELRSVLLTPSLVKNLLSVRQLCRENTVSVEFDEFGFSVKDLRTRMVILRSDSEGDLYLVAGASSSRPTLPFAGTVTTDLWHQRLGHPGRAPLAGFEFACTPSSTHSCRACRLGKHTQLPFQQSSSSSLFPVAFRYLDVSSGECFWLSVLPCDSR